MIYGNNVIKKRFCPQKCHNAEHGETNSKENPGMAKNVIYKIQSVHYQSVAFMGNLGGAI